MIKKNSSLIYDYVHHLIVVDEKRHFTFEMITELKPFSLVHPDDVALGEVKVLESILRDAANKSGLELEYDMDGDYYKFI